MKRGNSTRLQLLLETDKNLVNLKDSRGATPLHHSCYRGHLDCVYLLLDFGAVIDAPDAENCTPLHNAAFTGNDTVTLLLIQRGFIFLNF